MLGSMSRSTVAMVHSKHYRGCFWMPYWLDVIPVWGSASVQIISVAVTGPNIPIVSGRDNQVADLQSCILGRWMHSHEEDMQGVMAFRPKDFSFPPSRGRRGFDFREGG